MVALPSEEQEILESKFSVFWSFMGEIQTSGATVSGSEEEGGQSALSRAVPAQHLALSPVALLQTVAKTSILPRWHMAQRERQEIPWFLFGPCHWPGDHGDIAKPP